MACLCNEISKIKSDIQILDDAINSLMPTSELIASIKSELSNISSGSSAYVSPNNLDELVLNINNFYDTRETSINSLFDSCKNKRETLNSRLNRYIKEDEEFHEAERKRQEEEAEAEKQKNFIGPPVPNFR